MLEQLGKLIIPVEPIKPSDLMVKQTSRNDDIIEDVNYLIKYYFNGREARIPSERIGPFKMDDWNNVKAQYTGWTIQENSEELIFTPTLK